MACGASFNRPRHGIAERTPKGRTSYDAASTTPRRRCPPTITGLPFSSGRSRCSTEA